MNWRRFNARRKEERAARRKEKVREINAVAAKEKRLLPENEVETIFKLLLNIPSQGRDLPEPPP